MYRHPARTAASVGVAVVVMGLALSVLLPVGDNLPSADALSQAAGASSSPVTAARPVVEAPAVPLAERGTTPAVAVPGIGPVTWAQVPADSSQVVVVVAGTGGPAAMATTWQRSPDGWRAAASWPASVGARGFATARTEGSLTTPTGVFTLSDAGGLLADPGTAMPYTRSDHFEPDGRSVDGSSLAGAFDYVLAIDYNRVPGRSPLDTATPLGPDPGSGIWFHVSHDGPTRGCVALTEDAMRSLLQWVTPSAHPVVVMGPASTLAG